MANKYRGEVEFEALGKKYILRCGAKENAAAETELKIDDPLSAVGSLNINQTVTLFRHMLSNRHPDLTQDEAADLITEMGMLNGAMKLLTRSVRLSNDLPEFETDEEKAKTVEKAQKLMAFTARLEGAGGEKLTAGEIRALRMDYIGTLEESDLDPKAPSGSTGSNCEPPASARD